MVVIQGKGTISVTEPGRDRGTYFEEVVFQATIRKNVKLDEAQSHHKSVFDYAPKSTGATEYGSLVEEVIHRESTCPRRKSTGETSR